MCHIVINVKGCVQPSWVMLVKKQDCLIDHCGMLTLEGGKGQIVQTAV